MSAALPLSSFSCLRAFQNPEDVAKCIDELEQRSILAIADETRRLAADLRLV